MMAFLETGNTMSPWYNRDLNSGYISDNKINERLKNVNFNVKNNLTLCYNTFKYSTLDKSVRSSHPVLTIL